MKKLINSRIKKYFGTQIKFCAYQKYHFRGHVRKIERVENSIKNLNKFLNPLKLKVEVIPTNCDIEIDFEGVELQINYDYNPAEPETGFYESFNLLSIKHKGVDVWDLVDERLEEIEDKTYKTVIS